MTTAPDLDARIRSAVLTLVDSAPPAPAISQLEHLGAPSLVGPVRRWTGGGHRGGRHRPGRRVAGWRLAGVGLAVAATVGVAVLLVQPPATSPVVTEATLGMHVAGYTAVGPSPAPPPGYVVVATGTTFGRPWTVAGPPPSSGRYGYSLDYAGRSLIAGSGSLEQPADPPTWFKGAHAGVDMGVGVARDDQRFLVGATNGPVASVTVRAKGGTSVTGSVLPHRLGTVSFFLLSLGRQGDCHQLCQGSIRVTLTGSGGRALTTQQVSDFAATSTYLNAPPVTSPKGKP